MTKDSMEKIAADAHKLVRGRELLEDSASRIVAATCSFRYLFDEAVENPWRTFLRMFQRRDADQVIYPCDVIDLRSILQNQSISRFEPTVPTFSLRFADKYLSSYPIFLTLRLSAIDSPYADYHGVVIFPEQPLDVAGAIVRVTVNQPSPPEAVSEAQRIVREAGNGVDFGVTNHVPYLSGSNPKLAFNLAKGSGQQKE